MSIRIVEVDDLPRLIGARWQHRQPAAFEHGACSLRVLDKEDDISRLVPGTRELDAVVARAVEREDHAASVETHAVGILLDDVEADLFRIKCA